MFVTSLAYQPGTLGGLDGADRACQDRARAGGLPGTFKAWLSTSTVDARSRFSVARGWIRPDRRPFADTIPALVDGQMYYPPRLNEAGGDVVAADGDVLVATGTLPDGTRATDTAADWTSTAALYAVGGPAATNEDWTGNRGTAPGTAQARLYCLAVDQNTPLAIPRFPGRLAFLSAGSFSPATGESMADQMCDMEAHLNGHAGTFLALLATRVHSAAGLFDLTGPTWVRLDGVPWLERGQDLATGALLTSLNVAFPTGGSQPLYIAYAPVWSGTANPGQPSATPDQDCTDWSASSGTGTFGWSSYSDGSAFKFNALACNDPTVPRLYCLER
jgi:hypothetical protein